MSSRVVCISFWLVLLLRQPVPISSAPMVINNSPSFSVVEEVAKIVSPRGNGRLYHRYPDWVEPVNESNYASLNQPWLPSTIRVYNSEQRRWVTYDRLNSFWANMSTNSYTFKIDEKQQPVVKAVLKIYWTLDESTIPDDVRIIAVKEAARQQLPKLPLFVDATNLLSREQRSRIIIGALQDTFDYWSDTLYNRVVFEFMRYGRHLKDSQHFKSVVTVSMNDMTHIDEHTNTTDYFLDARTLAHAYANFIHFNREGAKFYIAPHLMSKRVPAIIERDSSQTGVNLYEISTNQLAERYRMKNYTTLYRQRQHNLYRLVGARGFQHDGQETYWCMACVALHEIAHVIGLGHSDDKNTLMFPTNQLNEAIIAETDKLAMRKLYEPFLTRVQKSEAKAEMDRCRSNNKKMINVANTKR